MAQLQYGLLTELLDMAITAEGNPWIMDLKLPFDLPDPALWAISSILASKGALGVDVHMEHDNWLRIAFDAPGDW